MRQNSERPWYRQVKDGWYAWQDGRQVSLGVKGRNNRKAALEAFYRLMASGPKPKPTDSPPTVRDVVEAFLSDVEGRAKPKTVEVYRYLLADFLTQHGDRRADVVKPHEAEQFARKPTWSPSTRNGFLGALVSAFRWAVRAGVLSASQFAGFAVRKSPKASRGAKAVITADQFGRLYDAASPAFRPFMRGLWLTGCRPGELAKLTAADVDLGNGVVVLADHKTAAATGTPRIIFLSPEAVALFKEQAEKHPAGPIFRNTDGTAWNEDSVVGAMKKARERAVLPHATAYGFRHSYATAALVAGVPDASVAALLGHVGTGMLHKHYSHLTSRADVLRKAAAKVR